MRFCKNTTHVLSQRIDVLITTTKPIQRGACRSEAELCSMGGAVRAPKEGCVSQLHPDSLPSKVAGCDRLLLQNEPWGDWSAS